MRLSGRNVTTNVQTSPNYTCRPVRLHIGGAVYRMECDEAIELATALANVVQEINRQETQQ